MGSMNAVLQIQPAETPNIVSFNPAAPSKLSTAAAKAAAARRPVRARSLIAALAVGALIGGLISLSAVSDPAPLTGDDIKTEAVGG